MGKPLGIVLYDGKSLLDGEPIVAIATGIGEKTENEKTGEMVQVWILRRDISPEFAVKLGKDASICGDCKQKDFGSCYVNICHGPAPIYKAFHNNRYAKFEPSLIKYFKDKNVRLGAYGDPAAVPIEIWQTICSVAKTHTGYTHQWRKCEPDLKNYCMASVDSITNYYKEVYEAQKAGWRTFRVRVAEDNFRLENEFICPASKEGGTKISCDKCGACGGLSSRIKRNPVIIAHGGGVYEFKVKRYIAGMKKLKNKKKWRVDFSKRYKEFCDLCRL